MYAYTHEASHVRLIVHSCTVSCIISYRFYTTCSMHTKVSCTCTIRTHVYTRVQHILLYNNNMYLLHSCMSCTVHPYFFYFFLIKNEDPFDDKMILFYLNTVYNVATYLFIIYFFSSIANLFRLVNYNMCYNPYSL